MDNPGDNLSAAVEVAVFVIAVTAAVLFVDWAWARRRRPAEQLKE